jgi:hypothetical protein
MSENEKPSEMSLLDKNDTNAAEPSAAKIAAAVAECRNPLVLSGFSAEACDQMAARSRYEQILAEAYLAEHPADDAEPISLASVDEQFGHLICRRAACGVAFLLLRKSEWARWELAVWPPLGRESDCQLQVYRSGDPEPRDELRLPSLKTRGDLRRLLATLGCTVAPGNK